MMLGNRLLIMSILVTGAIGHSGSKHACGTSSKRVRRDDLEVLGHLINHNSLYHKVGRSVYFSGSEIVKLRTATLNNHKFTVELWIKPEGGQLSGVPILNFYDRCLIHTDSKLWHLGLKETQKGRDMRFYFALNTHRIKEPHEIIAHESIRPDTWVHLAVVFNGSAVKLYINQAQIGVSHKELSPVSSVPVKKCEVLELGGDSRVSRFFRGTVDDLRLWNVAKSQRAIVRDMFKTDFNLNNEELALYEKFEDVPRNGKFESSYKSVTVSLPEHVVSTVPKDLHQIEARKPLCGVTVCDNPDVVRGYKENIHLRRERLLRYRLIYFSDDDGKNPLVTTKQIKKQHKKLNSAFSKHNITWQLSIHEIRNTSLKEKTVLVTCNPSKIGDGICHDHCNLKATGYDGGDCDRHERNNCKEGFNCPKCDRSMLNNGKCNPECNNLYRKWDGGDCCNKDFGKTSKTCLDPKSPNRGYITINELKEVVGLDNREYLNIYIGKLSSNLNGKATFPWDKFALGIQGGTVLKADRFGKNEGMSDMIHEIGHNLGLWHVHRGISESKCDDPCFETHASMELGDLCADTNPTPINHKCHEPAGGVCGIKRFKKAPYRNYMGYGGAQCPDHFTKDQVSRMHCYIDYLCQGWSLGNEPSTIPIKSKILSYAMGTVQFEWLPPLGFGNAFAVKNCNGCDIHGTKLRQFAVTAFSPITPKHEESQVPRQAVGPPDAKRCFTDSLVWVPDLSSNVETGFIDLGFEKEVIPSAIKIWVTYNFDKGTIDIELLHVDNSITSLGSAYAQCDMPYTKRIVTNKATKKVRIRPSGKDIGIDAVQLISEENSQHCKGCPRIEYMVNRKPPFQSGEPIRVKTTRFEDKEVQEDAHYEYQIQTAIGDQISPPSLPLKFSAKSGFCGDGIIERRNGEECDDANSRDGDGCSIQCKKEDVFRCKGQPSICYKYEGDGICEEFEKKISIVDCGFYVPDGFEQQWAVSANGNKKHKCRRKSYDVIIGPPPRDLKCIHSDPSKKISWRPCNQFSYDGDYWITATFAKPVVASAVVIYIASDGRSELKAGKHQNARIQLIDIKKTLHKIGADNIRIDCKRHPITIPVLHDMTKPYFKTKAVRIRFSFYGIAISAVALQSSTKLDPFVASSCDVATKEYYNPATQSCNPYNMKVPSCKPLVVKRMVVSCSGTKDGDSCKVACDKGHRPIKSITVTCIMGKWSKIDLKCVPANCGKIKIKRGQLDCREGTTYKSTCTFDCVGKSHIVGVDNQITCLADGLWSARKATCQMYCPAPPQIENSDPLDSRCEANHMKARRQNDMGTVCSFRCRPGFTLVALSKNAVGTHAQLTCKEDGKWVADSKCVPMKCPELSLFTSLVYNCSDRNNYGSICSTVCPKDERRHEVICEANGKWSSDFNHCNYKGRCEDLLSTKEIMFESCKNNVKGICIPKCKKGYDVVIRGQEELLNITLMCLPDLTWFPHQSMIYCFPSCKEKRKGNGVCDCHNNNKHCNYDNGECCPATIKGGGRVLFTEERGGESTYCKCIDPRARELIKKPVTAEPIEKGSKVSPLTGSGDDAFVNIYNDDEGGDDSIEVVQT